MTREERYLPALVDLAVEFGADVQPGQIVVVPVEIGQERLARAAAVAAYRRGARYVDVDYWDPHIKLARLQNADRETLDYVPPWIPAKILASGEQQAAVLAFAGETEPNLFSAIDPELLGLDILPHHPANMEVINARQVNWTILPAVTPAWAATVFPDLDEDAAVAALWEAVAEVCRLNEPDPAESWRARFVELNRVATALNALELDRLQYTGPGTDLTVGLLPGSRWLAAEFTTAWGHIHHPNLPTEEVFTTPDPERVDGHVTATRPLLVPGSAPIRGLRMRFEHGRAVSIEADSGAASLESMTRRTDDGSRLGEVALVDRSSRVGQTGRVFSNILLDENAASHLALGSAYELAVDGEESLGRINRSDIHVDFMIGSDELEVTGVTRAGDERALLRGGEWQI